MPRITQVTPFIFTNKFDKALNFYSEILGFSIGFKSADPDYAFLRRESAAIRLLNTGDNRDMTHPSAEQMVYFDVEDVDSLYEKMKEKLETLPSDRYRAPFDQFYGQREFHVHDEDMALLMFGEAIKPE